MELVAHHQTKHTKQRTSLYQPKEKELLSTPLGLFIPYLIITNDDHLERFVLLKVINILSGGRKTTKQVINVAISISNISSFLSSTFQLTQSAPPLCS